MYLRITRLGFLTCLVLLTLTFATAAPAAPPAPLVPPSSEVLGWDLDTLLTGMVCPSEPVAPPAVVWKVEECAACSPSTPCPRHMCDHCAGGPYCNASTQCVCRCVLPCVEEQ